MTTDQILTGAIELLSNKGLERRMYRAESLNLKLFALLRKVSLILDELDPRETGINTQAVYELHEELDSIQLGIEHY